MNLSQIESNLFVGSCPQNAEDVKSLRSEYGITAVLNLQTDEDMDDYDIDWDALSGAYEAAGIVARREPVRDFDAEALRQRLPDCVRALAELAAAGHTVYVHCSYGVNRSPTTVIAYLYRCRDWDLEQAIHHVVRSHSCDPLIHTIATADWTRVEGRRESTTDEQEGTE